MLKSIWKCKEHRIAKIALKKQRHFPVSKLL